MLNLLVLLLTIKSVLCIEYFHTDLDKNITISRDQITCQLGQLKTNENQVVYGAACLDQSSNIFCAFAKDIIVSELDPNNLPFKSLTVCKQSSGDLSNIQTYGEYLHVRDKRLCNYNCFAENQCTDFLCQTRCIVKCLKS